MAIKIVQYETENGDVPFKTWFDSLSSNAALKVNTATKRMELGNSGDHKSVGSGIWERRINFEKGYRIYYAKDGDELVLLFCGGTKSRQQADIDEAKAHWSDYKKRKRQQQKEQEEQERKAKSRRRRKRGR